MFKRVGGLPPGGNPAGVPLESEKPVNQPAKKESFVSKIISNVISRVWPMSNEAAPSVRESPSPLRGRDVSQLHIQSLQEEPFDVEGIKQEVAQTLDRSGELSEGSLVNREELFREMAELVELLESANEGVKVEEQILSYEEFTEPEMGEVLPSYDQVISKTEKYLGNGIHVSVKGMARAESEDPKYSTCEVEMNDGKVEVSKQAAVDWPRGNVYQVEGRPIHEEEGEIQAKELKGMVEKLEAAGVKREDVKTVSTIFNQGLLNPVVMFLAFQFPGVNINALPGGRLDLRKGEDGKPVIEGSAVYRFSDMGDPENSKYHRYMKVDVRVTNPGSDDPDVANVHYKFGPLSKTNPNVDEEIENSWEKM